MNKPYPCSECDKVFQWGLDEDSAIVERRGEHWLSCRENAHWKLTFHMEDEHPESTMECPRRAEGGVLANMGKDYWHELDGEMVCSYCGSLHPDALFQAIAAGHTITPTDKNYKIYVELPNPDAGKIIQTGSHSSPAYDMHTGEPNFPDLTMDEKLSGRCERPIMGEAPANLSFKFYFPHLSKEQMLHFIDLYNKQQISLAHPGHFYRRPFFMAPAEKTALN